MTDRKQTAVTSGRPTGRPTGRPKSEEKRQAILAAAGYCFMGIGFTASMDQIAAKAGVSKQTLYSHFKNKDVLFQAIVSDKVDGYFADIESTPLQGNVTDRLHQVGKHILELMADPQVGAMLRSVASQADVMPQVSDNFWIAGPGRMSGLVKTIFEKEGLSPNEASDRAWSFVYALAGPLMLSNALHQSNPIKNQAAHLKQTVMRFA